uniref:Uncharacterized protein n=1 Tax=Lygus hesperus TaxID=30085 RepID=A0A0A9YP08_LYGHE
MNMINTKAKLYKQKQSLMLLKILERIRGSTLYLSIQITRVSKLHYNQEKVVLLFVFNVLYDVRVITVCKTFDLTVCVCFVSRRHFAKIHRFGNKYLSIFDSLNQSSFSI